MNRYDGPTAIRVLQEMVAALGAHDCETRSPQRGDDLAPA